MELGHLKGSRVLPLGVSIALVKLTIPVLDQPEPKINFSVPSLRVTPVGVPTKAMLTMATLPTEYISPQRSSNPTTTNKSSFTLKESLVADSSTRCLKHKSSNPTTDLRTTPTRIHPNATNTANAVNAIAVVYPDVDDDDPDPNELPTDENATFLTEWDAFYDDFVQSSNSILARSANSNLPSLANAYV